MNVENYLWIIATNFVRHFPVLLIGVVGLWHALRLRNHAGIAASWASVGFALLIIHAILNVVRDVASLAIRVDGTLGPTALGLTLNSLALASYFPLVVALYVLGRAIFLGRDGFSDQSHSDASVRGSAG